jgi:hypothetical protein
MAKLLPNGKQVFLDDNGNPLGLGSVYMYVPSTTTFKDTWTDSGETTLNAKPTPLDAAGRAVLYGNGVYRQVVKDVNGVTIWDQLVAVYSDAPVLWGIATGTANNISVALQNGDLQIDSGNPIGGQLVNFIAAHTNTGATQVTVTWSGGGTNGPREIVKDTYIGPAPMVGGEIVQGNMISMIYDNASGEWFCINGIAVGLAYVPVAYSIFEPLASLKCPVILTRGYTLKSATPGSLAWAETPPSADVVVNIRKNTTVIGKITFTSSGNAGTIVLDPVVDITFSAGDLIVLDWPAIVDSAIQSIAVTFRLQRDING